MRTTVVLLALLACVLAQDFTCNLQYQTKVMRNGIVSGTFEMTAPAAGFARFKISLPAKVVGGVTQREAFTELVQFNSRNGLYGGTPLPYSDQIIFRTGTSCACETGYFDNSMPLLNPYDTNTQNYLDAFFVKGGKSTINPVCDVYTKRATPVTTNFPAASLNLITTPITEVHIDPTTKFPCYALWADDRKFTFSQCRNTVTDKTNAFKEPSGCKCGKPIDAVFVLDRSGSISVREFYDQKGFVIDFANQFEYSPLKANLAIINFQGTAWVHLKLTDGISEPNVNASVQSLGCPTSCDQNAGRSCTGNLDQCCCCCGTCISCGQRLGSDQFPTGRRFAFKLLIIITDGYHNTASPGFTCTSTATCNADLQAGVTYALSKVPDPTQLAIYAVGVGADREISEEQLLIVARGQKDHVLRRQSFAELASNNIELISRSCDQNLFPCGGCCGFCICGKCQPPDTCANETKCDIGNLPNLQVCCSTTPVSCAAQQAADRCHTYVCDPSNGTCVANTTVECGAAGNTTCFERRCIPATGTCNTSKTGNCPGVQECVVGNNTGCDDNNMCTTDRCVGPDGSCEWTVINCTQTMPGDKCNIPMCDPIRRGCYLNPVNVTATCDDNNLCTIDTCDPQIGCAYANVTNCADNDPCTIDMCDPLRGCIFVPKLCNITGNASCRISYCNETTGNCSIREVACGTVLPEGVIIGSAIGTAALVGIIIAAIICAAGAGAGGAYAYTQAAGNGDLAVVNPNPLYQGLGATGANPLYKG